MPCSKYKSKRQQGLCHLTKGWKDFSKVKGRKMKINTRRVRGVITSKKRRNL